MKVSISTTVEMSDEQRVLLADLLDGKTSRRKATRVEAKDFVWKRGSDWDIDLSDLWDEEFGTAPDADDDLIGGDDDEDLI